MLVLHAYSADNAGDGLLVNETLDLLRESIGECDVTMLASRPESFAHLGIPTFPTVPTKRGWDRRTKAVLSRIDDFDLVVGVGGGYLRAGTPVEALKAALVMGPQLAAAARSTAPTIYLPQSIGPAKLGTKRWLRSRLERVDVVMVRDDRSLSEIAARSMRRVPDLATAAIAAQRTSENGVDPVPVVSIRAVHGKVNPDVYRVADAIGTYDGYIQSTVGGNDDRKASATLSPRRVISRDDLMVPGVTPRVVVAVRLHAALMALAAGHYVVHLAYERKGFGAFDDLGVLPWVHSVNTFDVSVVVDQVRTLLTDSEARSDYDSRIRAASDHIATGRAGIITEMRRLARRP